MSETTEATEREKAARKIKDIRKFEQRDDYNGAWDRGIIDYIDAFEGLHQYFDYVRSLKAGGKVLDIGSGTTRGISQIADTKLGDQINFTATTLGKVKGSVESDKVRVVQTSAEALRGIDSGSISGILGLNSIGYSAAPQLVVDRMDQVLVAGGVIKAVFPPEGTDSKFSQMGLSSHNKFSEALKAKGYDIAFKPPINGTAEEIMLAIKSGGEAKTSASDLVRADSGIIDTLLLIDGHLGGNPSDLLS